MKKSTYISGIFIVVFLILSFVMSIFAVYKSQSEIPSLSVSEMIKGKWATTYEGIYDKSLFVQEPSKTLWGLINYTLFKEGREGVLIGKDGWLFTTEEFMVDHTTQSNIESNINYIAKVHDVFASQNVKMIVALVPAKARVYQDKIAPYKYPSDLEPIYHNIRGALKDNNIVVTDALWIMEKKKDEFELFLKTDTHWTPAGAKMTARQVANEMHKNFPDMQLEQTFYETKYGIDKPHDGDLMRYVPLGSFSDIGPENDLLRSTETNKIEISGPDMPEDDLSGALFGEEIIPVTLVGTSYSANPLWNFHGFLKEAMQTEILNAADEGMGPFETMKDYLNDEAFKTNPPQLVVWEIPERYVGMKYDLEDPSL